MFMWILIIIGDEVEVKPLEYHFIPWQWKARADMPLSVKGNIIYGRNA